MSKLSVITVDDDQDTREVFSEFLTLKGISVLGAAKNGKEGFELFNQKNPDVVLLDVMMPDYDGFYALKNIRKINPTAKVVMITADLSDGAEKRLNDLNATAIVYKPYEIAHVISVIKKVHNGSEIPTPERKVELISKCNN